MVKRLFEELIDDVAEIIEKAIDEIQKRIENTAEQFDSLLTEAEECMEKRIRAKEIGAQNGGENEPETDEQVSGSQGADNQAIDN